jgi:anti-sigma B factor antagonist
MMKYTCKIKSELFENIPLIMIEGDLTRDAETDVKSAYFEFTKKYSMEKVIINFDKTKFINSSGIAILISIIHDMNEKSGIVVFTGMSDHFKKVMNIVGITDFIEIVDTNTDALEIEIN